MNVNEAIQSALKNYQAGHIQQAEILLKEILEVQSNNINAINLLGILYYQLKDYDSAIKYTKKLIDLNPGNAQAHYILAHCMQEKGQLDEANIHYQKSIQINPDFANAYYNLGAVCQDKGQLDDAIIFYQKALELNPNLAEAYDNLGICLRDKGQLDDAIKFYQKALQLNPSLAEAYCNIGTTLRDKGQFDDAIKYLRKALQINPCFIDAHYNLGLALIAHGKLEEAIAAFDMSLYHKPGYIKALWAKCISHIPIIYTAQSEISISRSRYYNELIKLRQTINLNSEQDIEDAAEVVGNVQPFNLPYQGLNDKELQRLYGELVCKIMAARYPDYTNQPNIPAPLSGEPLRVGIVSGHFYFHSVWKLFKGWIEKIDREKFNTYGYYTGKRRDKGSEIDRKYFYRFVENIYSFERLCQMIREDNLHVLIYPEIGMDPTVLRLAALRLAPIQCTSWGHPETSGLPTIDYFLSSDLMEPPDADDHYTEKLIRLPNLSIYYTPLDIPLTEVNRETFGLRQKSILYLCCQSLFKYLPQYDEIYPRIASKVDDCQFLFISHKSNNVTEQFRYRINQSFNKFGLTADDYIVFLQQLDAGRYNGINFLSDVYLDSIGWSGGNTTLEAIACNLPVITIPGDLMRGRHSSAILTMMGVTETIASTLDEYIELAVRLGLDSKYRKQISEKIAANKHFIYHDQACVAALEGFLERVTKKLR